MHGTLVWRVFRTLPKVRFVVTAFPNSVAADAVGSCTGLRQEISRQITLISAEFNTEQCAEFFANLRTCTRHLRWHRSVRVLHEMDGSSQVEAISFLTTGRSLSRSIR